MNVEKSNLIKIKDDKVIVTEKKLRGPIVRHNIDKNLKNGVRRIVKEFYKQLDTQAEKFVTQKKLRNEHLFKDETVKADVLKALRQKLVYTLRKGMLEREDLETEIAVLAAMVWFGRQKKELQDRILEGM